MVHVSFLGANAFPYHVLSCWEVLGSVTLNFPFQVSTPEKQLGEIPSGFQPPPTEAGADVQYRTGREHSKRTIIHKE